MNEGGQPKSNQTGQGLHMMIGVALSVLIVALSWTEFYETQEASTYDFRFQMRNRFFGAPEQLPWVATVDIDDPALQEFGFPFTRDLHARLLDILHAYDAEMIGFDIFFYEPSQLVLSQEDLDALQSDSMSRIQVLSMVKNFDQEFKESSAASGLVYLAQTFEVAEKGEAFARENLRQRSPDDEEALSSLEPFSIPLKPGSDLGFLHTTDIEIPLPDFVAASRGVGFALPKPDPDGIVRRYRIALAYDGRLYFALSFIMAADYLQVPVGNFRIVPGEYVELPNAHFPDGSVKDLRVPIGENGEMLVNWAGPYHSTYRHLPYNLILNFPENEPRNRALEIAKRTAVEAPDTFADPELYLQTAAGADGGDLSADLLMEMWSVVDLCRTIETGLLENPDLTARDFGQSLGVPEEELDGFAQQFRGYFTEIGNNLRILEVLQKNPDFALDKVGQAIDVNRLEDIKYGVGVLRDLIRNGGVRPEHHPLYFLDIITSAGLHGDESADRFIRADDFRGAILFYGLTATGTHDLNPTPFGAREPMLGAHVNVFNTILVEGFLHRVPKWANAGIMLAFGLLIGLLIPRFKALPGALIVLVSLSVYVLTAFLLFAQAGVWVDTIGPVASLVFGYLSITLYNYVQKEKEKDFVQGAFGHYLDPKVIDQLVANPDSVGQLGGVQRYMTAFFSDVASFSGISENLTPVELVELLNEYLSEMCEIIAQHGGTIDKFAGDAIIAFYGAPIEIDDHASRAVLAVVDMQEKIAELRKNWETEGQMEELRQMWVDQKRGQFFRVRMGINTGDMVVGNMGSNTRVDYTIMGDAVNLAARLEGAGKAYNVSTMISQSSYEGASDVIDARLLDSIRVVGKNKPVKVYEILGRKGQVDPKKMEIVGLYDAAMEFYRQRQWPEAIAGFQKALDVDPEDGPSGVFIERCRGYQQTPPPEAWDAVFDLDSK